MFLFPAYLEKNGNKLQRNLESKYKELIISNEELEGEPAEVVKPEQKETKKKK